MTTTKPDLVALWQEHLRHEFDTKSTPHTLDTMVDGAYVNHIPVLTGGHGKPALDHFYSTHFIPEMPPDVELVPISRNRKSAEPEPVLPIATAGIREMP